MEFIEFICPKCDQSIVWTVEHAKVQCPRCHKWVSNKNMKRRNPCKLDEDKKKDQLRMF